MKIVGFSKNDIEEALKTPWGNICGRFMTQKKSIHLISGELYGGNVINQMFYFDISKDRVNKILEILKRNNPGLNFKFVKSE